MDDQLWISVLGAIGLLALGLALLAAGGESLVRAASRLATVLGLSPLFIGLTLVAYGTSAPELVVTSMAALRDLPGVALGNAIGSNIFNSGVVLGIATLIAPFPCKTRLIRREVLLGGFATGLVILLSINGRLARPESTVLILILILYTGWAYRRSTRNAGSPTIIPAATLAAGPGKLKSGLLVVAGLAMLILGASWAVDGAVTLAGILGISETVIGLTVVAAGTSLPELATSTVAALRGQHEIAIGNVLGSNLFNILGILGVSGLLRPLMVPSHILRLDLPVALVFALACIPIGLSGGRVSRMEGALLLMGYLAYLIALIYLRA